MSLELALIDAARQGDDEAVLALLEQGADPKSSEPLAGITALHAMAGMGHYSMVVELIKRGSDVCAETQNVGSTALGDAAIGGHRQLVDLLLAHGARLSQREIFQWKILDGEVEPDIAARIIMAMEHAGEASRDPVP